VPTALEYIHALAEESGEFGTFTTTSAGTTTTLVCSRLANTTLAATEFAGMYVLIESGPLAGEVAHIQGGGLARSTGTLTVADAFSSAVGSGVTFGLYRLLPPIDGDNVLPSYLKVVNWSIRRIPVERTIAVSAVTNQLYYSFDQDAYPWLTDAARIAWIEAPTTQAEEFPRRLPDTAWDWETDAETRRLVLYHAPFRTGETFKVRVYTPGNARLVKSGAGLVTLASTAVSSIAVVAPGYYSATPTVTISGGGGSGATATATLTSGAITSFTVTAAGTGYTALPTVAITRDAADTGWSDQATQTAGLSTLTDEAMVDVAHVVTMGTALMFRALSRLRAPSAVVVEWLAKAQPSFRAAKELQHAELPRDRTAGQAQLRPVRVRYRGRR
jgi:hypothetical protein